MSNVISLKARQSAIVEDAIASLHAGTIASYVLASLHGNTKAMDDIRAFAAGVDARHPGEHSLVAQLDALSVSQAA
ncbi:hypothetical protein ACLF6K_37370 [Streptomyces xanthophaeus]|uniref:hypothetical protein n=1 Tax=Streptomyces xanthophaeus TaxID=67385 RepID=UPI00398FCD51